MAYRYTSGYSFDTILRWVDLVVLIIFFLVCTGKEGPAFPDIASIRLWEGGILVLLVYSWKYIFSFMHTERSSTLYEAWKDIIIRNCVAITLGWVITLLYIFLIDSSILLFDLPGKERNFLHIGTIQSFFAYWGLLLLFFLLYRILAAIVLRKIKQPLSYALIVGLNVRSLALAENLRRNASDYKFLGFADTLEKEDAQLYSEALTVVCSLQGVEEYIATHRIDEIFLTLPVRSFYDEMKHIIQYGTSMGLTVRVLNDLFTFETRTFNYIDGDLAYFTADSPLPDTEGLQRDIKYLSDRIIAFCALFFFIPLFLAAWVLIFLQCPFFLKEYIGLNKQTFRMVQFKNIQAIAFLQKRGLRNIPWLVNILMGDMSIIGPKPVPVQDIGAYNTLDQRRFGVKPGLIPPHHRKKERILSLEEDIRVELDYIVNWDLLTDCKILINFIKKYITRLAGHESN